MATLDIIVKPKLKFSLKKCGEVVPYGITPEERAKLAGIEENANDYTHPEKHPSSILDVVDEVNGAANKFLNERGEMVLVATSSIGVTGSQLYASTANSDVVGYKSLAGTPQALETEITLTAKSTNGIVWGDKYLSAPFTEAVTIPATSYGFDYWRKVSAANGTSRKHLRVFIYRAGVETNISTPLASPEIDETDFTERQISYIFPELALLAGDRIGIQEGFSTTHANNVTLTYIVGDGRGWFMRLPLPLKHESLTDKNSEAAFQHIDTTITKPALDAADMVAIKDSVTGKMILTPKSNFGAAVVQSTGISETDVMSQKSVTDELAAKEVKANKQNSLAVDGTGEKFPTVDAVKTRADEIESLIIRKLVTPLGATYNTTTKLYSLNGLTDITEAQMINIYNHFSPLANSRNWAEAFIATPIRTNTKIPYQGGGTVSTENRAFTSCVTLEVFKAVKLVYNTTNMFSGCTSLREVDYLLFVNITSDMLTNTFNNCTSLEICNLRGVKANLSIQWSPLLSLASLQYIIQYRANGTTAITITVHPTVFAKLTDNVNYPTWYAVAQDALTKYITFATV